MTEEDLIATIEWVGAWKVSDINGEGLHLSIGFFGGIFWRDHAYAPEWTANNTWHPGIYIEAKTN